VAIDPRIARVVDKLERVRARRPETFGANAHQYALAPPLGDDAVRALEAAHQIALPEAYRAFLVHVGASGAGPYYGLLPPARWNSALLGDVAMPDFAARACVWTAETPRDEATYAARTAELDEPFQGAIALADQGCAYYAMLVTAGPERGRVMYVGLDGGVPYFPENVDFLAWYERWLDELLWGFKHSWFGTFMPGDEVTLAAAARPDDGPRRLAALAAMYQLPALAADTQAVVARRVRDDDPAVREVALRLARAHQLVPALDAEVRRALTDAAPGVRVAALEAVVAAGTDVEAAARRALADADAQVVSAAVSALQNASALTEDDLVALIGAASPSIRDRALEAARTVPSRAVFDAARALLPGLEAPREKVMFVVIAQVRHGVLDPPRVDAALALVLAGLAAATGPEPPTLLIHGLGAFTATHPAALATLIELTRHPEPFFRYDAAAALGKVGDADALPALRALATDPAMPRAPNHSTAWSVGENAKRAIARIEASLATRS